MKSFKALLAAILGLAFVVGVSAQIKMAGWPGNPSEELGVKAMVDAYNAKAPDAPLVWEPVPGNYAETLKTRLAGGTAPDLFYVDVSVLAEFARTGNLLPLDSYLNKYAIDVKSFFKPLIDGFTYNKRLYGIAKDFSTLALFYNKEIFRNAGVAVPVAGLTYNDLLATAQKLKAKGVELPLIVNPDFNRLIPFVKAFGGRVVDENLHIALSEPRSRAALQFYVDLVARYKVGGEASQVGAGWEGEAFGKEQVAMIMSGPWCLGFFKEQYPNVYDKMGILEMPLGPDKKTKASMIYTVAWSVNKATQNRDGALKALAFLVNEGQALFVQKAGVLGSNTKVAAADTDPIKKVFYNGAVYGTPWKVETPSGLFSRANDEINSRLKDLFYGKITMDEALKQIKENYDIWVE